MYFVISPTKLRRFRRNLVHSFRNKFAANTFKRFSPHLSNVSTLPCKTQGAHRARATTELLKKPHKLFYLTCSIRFARFKSSWLQSVRNIAREGVQNTHHCSGRTETAIVNGVGQAGLRRHCRRHSSVASLTGPDE